MSTLLDPGVEFTDGEFGIMRDGPQYEKERAFLQQLWQVYEPYADRHFKAELAHQFHQRFWEMYLACGLMNQGFELLPKQDGPDICFMMGDSRVWLEACAPRGGKGRDAVKVPETDLVTVPEGGIILRYRSVIEAKYRQYTRYCDSGLVEVKEPYVIAVNGARVPLSGADDDIPLIVQAVLPIDPNTVTIDLRTRQVVDHRLHYRPEIPKKSGAAVSTRVFVDEAYSGISGVLFSNSSASYHSASIGEEFVFIHNARASSPLPQGWLPVGREFWVAGASLKQKNWNM
jgi:hypothetical protein